MRWKRANDGLTPSPTNDAKRGATSLTMKKDKYKKKNIQSVGPKQINKNVYTSYIQPRREKRTPTSGNLVPSLWRKCLTSDVCQLSCQLNCGSSVDISGF